MLFERGEKEENSLIPLDVQFNFDRLKWHQNFTKSSFLRFTEPVPHVAKSLKVDSSLLHELTSTIFVLPLN